MSTAWNWSRTLLGLVLASVLMLHSIGARAQGEEDGERAPATERQSGKVLGKGTKPAILDLRGPRGGWTHDQMVEVTGKVSDVTINPIEVNINGERYLLKTFNGEFKRKFPVTRGKNSIRVQAQNKGGLTVAERTLFAEVPGSQLSAVLTSDTDGVYTDLHIYEPDPNTPDPKLENVPKNHVYWADTKSKTGGRFYLNEQGGSFDQPGYGPYLYTHASPPLGIYRIDANYWPSGDKAHTLSSLNLQLFGGTAKEIKRSVRLPLVTPGETVTLCYVRIMKGQEANVYCPGVDKKSSAEGLWPAWVLAAPLSRNGTDGE